MYVCMYECSKVHYTVCHPHSLGQPSFLQKHVVRLPFIMTMYMVVLKSFLKGERRMADSK